MAEVKKQGVKNQTVMITGATSGIGLETARIFAEHKWNLLCHYNKLSKKIDIIKGFARDNNVGCEFIKADFSSEAQLKSLIKKVQRIVIGSLINNAGTYISQKHFSELDLEEIRKTFMINLFSAMLLSSAVFAGMKKDSFGRIVNISSIAAKYGGSSFSLPYGCSKSGLEGLTKTLAKEGAEFNILVNTVRPGVIDTDFHRKFPKNMDKRVAMIPMKRMGNPREVAKMIYYLGSGENTFITNEVIAVSGGE